jgi:hypothetical protein
MKNSIMKQLKMKLILKILQLTNKIKLKN